MKHIRTNCCSTWGRFGLTTEEMHAIGGTPFNMTVAACACPGGECCRAMMVETAEAM